MVSAVFKISIFFVSCLYMLLNILFVFYYCLRQSALERWSAGALGDRARCKARDAVARSEM